MNASPFGHKRAEQFDDLLEGRIDQAPDELRDLLAFAERVWAVPAPTPRAEFTASLRERLMAEAPLAMADGATDHRLSLAPIISAGSAKRRRRLAAAVAVVSIGAAATGTAFAAEDALPGEGLYPIKRLVESAQTTFAFSDTAKGRAELDQAATRLSEATALAQAGDTTRARETLEDFVDQAHTGSELLTDAGQAPEVHDFTATSVSDLDQISGLLPTEVIAPVVQALVAIDQAVTQAFPEAGPGITTLPTSLVQMLASTLNPLQPGIPATPGETSTGRDPKPAAVLTPSPTATKAPVPKSSTTPAPGSAPTPRATRTPKPAPSSLGEVVGEVGDGVGNGVVGGLGGALSSAGASVGGPVGGLVSGVGEAVTGVGGAVGDLLGGVGGLLTPPSSSPTK